MEIKEKSALSSMRNGLRYLLTALSAHYQRGRVGKQSGASFFKEERGGVAEEGEGSRGVGASQSPAVPRRVNSPPGTTRTGRLFSFFNPERIFSLRMIFY